MSNLDPSLVLAEAPADGSTFDRGCKCGSMHTSLHTSDIQLLMVSLTSLGLMERNPPSGRREHAQLRSEFHRHKRRVSWWGANRIWGPGCLERHLCAGWIRILWLRVRWARRRHPSFEPGVMAWHSGSVTAALMASAADTAVASRSLRIAYTSRPAQAVRPVRFWPYHFLDSKLCVGKAYADSVLGNYCTSRQHTRLLHVSVSKFKRSL